MALKNLEEAMVERIQRALAKELQRLRRRARRAHNGDELDGSLGRRPESTATDATGRDESPSMSV